MITALHYSHICNSLSSEITPQNFSPASVPLHFLSTMDVLSLLCAMAYDVSFSVTCSFYIYYANINYPTAMRRYTHRLDQSIEAEKLASRKERRNQAEVENSDIKLTPCFRRVL